MWNEVQETHAHSYRRWTLPDRIGIRSSNSCVILQCFHSIIPSDLHSTLRSVWLAEHRSGGSVGPIGTYCLESPLTNAPEAGLDLLVSRGYLAAWLLQSTSVFYIHSHVCVCMCVSVSAYACVISAHIRDNTFVLSGYDSNV